LKIKTVYYPPLKKSFYTVRQHYTVVDLIALCMCQHMFVSCN